MAMGAGRPFMPIGFPPPPGEVTNLAPPVMCENQIDKKKQSSVIVIFIISYFISYLKQVRKNR